MKNIPFDIQDYLKRIEQRRQNFYANSELPSITRDSRRKFAPNGDINEFHGWSIVYFLQPESEASRKLIELRTQFHESLQQAGIISKFAFLPPDTYHITIVGITTNQPERISVEIKKGVTESFKTFQKEKLHAPRVIVKGDITPDIATVIAPIVPVDTRSLETIYHIREDIRQRLHPLGNDIVRNTPLNFHGHITIAYIVNTLDKTEYAKLIEILRQFEMTKPLGEVLISKISLHYFKTMTDWGNPVLNMSLE